MDIALDPGAGTLVVDHLPADIIRESVRVEGETSGDLELGSVDARRIVVKQPGSADTLDDNERKRIEEQIEALGDRRAALDGVIAAARAQQELAQNLTRLPVGPWPWPWAKGAEAAAPAPAAAAEPDWNSLFDLIGTRIGDAAKTIQQAEIDQRNLDEQIRILRERLALEPPEEWERTELRILVTATSVVSGQLRIRYQTQAARWQPFYDARLATRGDGQEPALTLVRRAEITQETGEDWDDVRLTLSTTRPGDSTAAPDLPPMKVDFAPPPRPLVSAPGFRRRAMEMDAEDAGRDMAMSPAPAQAAMGERAAEVERYPYQAAFRITQPATIKSGVGAKKVHVATESVTPTLTVVTVPKIDPRAYLSSKFTHDGDVPLLPGAVALYRDGIYVGRGALPLIAAGDEHELGFGADDAVTVSRVEVGRTKGETGLIATTKADEQHYRITVTNLHSWPMPVTVIDQMPYAEDERITVALLPATTEPSERNYDDKLGLLAWRYELKPSEKRDITLAYEIAWPAKHEIVVTGH